MIRATVAELLHQVRLFDTMSVGTSGRLVVFNYHRIRENEDEIPRFNKDLFGPSSAVFEEQIRWLTHNTRIISQEELLSSIMSGRLPDARCSMVTFDDGYRDNYTLAYPILKKYGVPAVFFIPTQLIETRHVGWWDVIAYLINNSSNRFINYHGDSYKLNGNRSMVIGKFIHEMCRESAAKTAGLLNQLSDLCEVEIPSTELQSTELMSWDEIREVSRNGITIGSHTHSHPVLATLDVSAQEFELTESRRMIQSRVDVDPESLAYPVGNYNAFTEATKHLAPQCGYKIAYSFATGFNDWPCDRFDIRRISGPQTLAFFAGKASFPWMFGRA